MRRLFATLALGCAFILALAGAARAEGVSVELNKLEPGENACTVYLLVNNTSQDAYDTLRAELYIFDRNGQIHRNYAYDIGPLRAAKRTVKAFVVNGIACDGISEVLLTDILDCKIGGADVDNCLDRVTVSSRAGAPLSK